MLLSGCDVKIWQRPRLGAGVAEDEGSGATTAEWTSASNSLAEMTSSFTAVKVEMNAF